MKTNHKSSHKSNDKFNHKSNKTFKKMNCAPNAPNTRNKTRRQQSSSCFDISALKIIKTHYNEDERNPNKITTDKPHLIWNQLRKQVRECNDEKCWIKNIPDTNIQQKLIKMYFAPEKPSSWNQNKHEWLSNFDIKKVLQQYENKYPHFEFIGPTPIDFDSLVQGTCVWEELCKIDLNDLIKRGKKKVGIIFNLDKHDEPGSHWVSLMIDMENRYVMYFDSNGISCPTEICKLMDRVIFQGKQLEQPIHLKKIQNKVRHQYSNSECGMYSLYFIITHIIETINGKEASSKEIVKHFTDKRIPDDFVFRLRYKYFN